MSLSNYLITVTLGHQGRPLFCGSVSRHAVNTELLQSDPNKLWKAPRPENPFVSTHRTLTSL